MSEEIWEIVYYTAMNGKSPYHEWFLSLSDLVARDVVFSRLARLRYGNFGKCESIGTGISELKVDYGPGYRVYFGKIGNRVILLLCGGNKSTQQKDIRVAQLYWKYYKEKNK